MNTDKTPNKLSFTVEYSVKLPKFHASVLHPNKIKWIDYYFPRNISLSAKQFFTYNNN